MDISSLIAIVIAIVAIYFFIKLIVSPIIKAVLGVIIFIAVIYLLQRFFGFNIDQILAPFGISFNLANWGPGFNWILGPANHYIDQIQNFANFVWGNVIKSYKQQ
jgi:hypothetical protein